MYQKCGRCKKPFQISTLTCPYCGQLRIVSPPEAINPPPRSHTTDPDTSKRAERQMRKSGKLGRHARAVYDVLVHATEAMRGSAISDALEGAEGFAEEDHKRLYQVRRRLSDLFLAGKVERVTLGTSREVGWRVAKPKT
jgi:hypothetical protein